MLMFKEQYVKLMIVVVFVVIVVVQVYNLSLEMLPNSLNEGELLWSQRSSSDPNRRWCEYGYQRISLCMIIKKIFGILHTNSSSF